jgi:hypothetical protein
MNRTPGAVTHLAPACRRACTKHHMVPPADWRMKTFTQSFDNCQFHKAKVYKINREINFMTDNLAKHALSDLVLLIVLLTA